MKKKLFLKILNIGLASLMLITTITACITKGFTDFKFSATEPNSNIKEYVNQSEVEGSGIAKRVLLSFNSTTPLKEGEEGDVIKTGVSKTITATVLPVNAINKLVDWNVEWNVPVEDNADISEYLSVSTEEDGSNIATITAYKGFEGASAYVVCTTRDGGLEARCLVRFEGAPDTFTFKYNDIEFDSVQMFNVNAGETYDIDLVLNNALGCVGSKFNDFEIVSTAMRGKFVAEKKTYNNGTLVETEEVVLNLADGVAGDFEINTNMFFTAEIKEGMLQLKTIMAEDTFALPQVPSNQVRTGTQFTYKAPYYDPRGGGLADNCFFSVQIREKASGKEALLYFDMQSDVVSVSLSEGEILI